MVNIFICHFPNIMNKSSIFYLFLFQKTSLMGVMSNSCFVVSCSNIRILVIICEYITLVDYVVSFEYIGEFPLVYISVATNIIKLTRVHILLIGVIIIYGTCPRYLMVSCYERILYFLIPCYALCCYFL